MWIQAQHMPNTQVNIVLVFAVCAWNSHYRIKITQQSHFFLARKVRRDRIKRRLTIDIVVIPSYRPMSQWGEFQSSTSIYMYYKFRILGRKDGEAAREI